MKEMILRDVLRDITWIKSIIEGKFVEKRKNGRLI